MTITQYVTVNITANTVTSQRPSFGKPLLLVHGSQFGQEEVKTYRSVSQVADDFESTDMPYLMATKVFSQQPSVTEIKVALLSTPTGSAQQIQIDLNSMTSGALTGSLVSPSGSVTSILADAGANTAATALNLSNAIGAVTGISASSAGNVVTTTTAQAGNMFHFSTTKGRVGILDITGDWNYDDRLDDVEDISDDFYAVLIDNNSAKNINKVARWVSSRNKIALFSPQVSTPSDWDSDLFDAAADLTALNANDRVALLFTKDPRTEAKEAAWAGNCLPRDPGTQTWAFKDLASTGVDTWTASEETTILGTGVNANVYKSVAGRNITDPGKTTGGEWIDVTRTIDKIKSDMELGIFDLLATSPKVPYTDKGAAAVENEVRAVLTAAERNGVIDAGWTTHVLPVAEQTTADRAARILREVEFQARLTGAIHTVIVNGTVNV